MKILEFTTQVEAQLCLDAIDLMAINFWQKNNFTVLSDENSGTKELVGKNAHTGNNAFNKATTKSWSTVEESPDNTFYIDSLTGTKFEYKYINDVPVKVVDLLAQEGFTFIEKDFPQEWIEDSISNI